MRDKVLIEALEKIIAAKDKAQSTQDLFHVLQEIDKSRIALSEYKSGEEPEVIIIWKDGDHKVVSKKSAWEFENDKDWLVTIAIP